MGTGPSAFTLGVLFFCLLFLVNKNIVCVSGGHSWLGFLLIAILTKLIQ
jgi:hypothetical protein